MRFVAHLLSLSPLMGNFFSLKPLLVSHYASSRQCIRIASTETLSLGVYVRVRDQSLYLSLVSLTLYLSVSAIFAWCRLCVCVRTVYIMPFSNYYLCLNGVSFMDDTIQAWFAVITRLMGLYVLWRKLIRGWKTRIGLLCMRLNFRAAAWCLFEFALRRAHRV